MEQKNKNQISDIDFVYSVLNKFIEQLDLDTDVVYDNENDLAQLIFFDGFKSEAGNDYALLTFIECDVHGLMFNVELHINNIKIKNDLETLQHINYLNSIYPHIKIRLAKESAYIADGVDDKMMLCFSISHDKEFLDADYLISSLAVLVNLATRITDEEFPRALQDFKDYEHME